MSKEPTNDCGCGPVACTPPTRREFVSLLGLSAAGLIGSARIAQAIAGPFAAADLAQGLVPEDKKFTRAWLDSLVARGAPTEYRLSRNELGFIGMPVGGITTGQLYLGGDGQPWLWDIFNQKPEPEASSGAGPHYAKPEEPVSPLSHGFALRTISSSGTQVASLERHGFAEIVFRGQYPIAFVEFRDGRLPVDVDLAAYSPFVPLELESSNLPATILEFRVRNKTADKLTVELGGWLENAVCHASGRAGALARSNELVRGYDLSFIACSAKSTPILERVPQRPPILFADFEGPDYAGWTATGTAFGDKPRRKSDIASYQGELDMHGEGAVNSHETRHGEDVAAGDRHAGTLTSPEFAIERPFIAFRIGGGKHPGETCLQLQIDGKSVREATGRDENRMQREHFDVREFAGRRARLVVLDQSSGAWGNIGVDEITFCDVPPSEPYVAEEAEDFGTLALALVEGEGDVFGAPDVTGLLFEAALQDFERVNGPQDRTRVASEDIPFPGKLVGALGTRLHLRPHAETTVRFVIAWRFDGLWRESLGFLPGIEQRRRRYGTRFADALGVVQHVLKNYSALRGSTFAWHECWYGGTLPWWLLERTLASATTLCTSTCLDFDDGRFYGWEGVGCCAGTCTHVWHYAQAVARLFPEIERGLRERVDYGLLFHEDTGAIDYRGEAARSLAVDGQTGTILRAYREHQMSADAGFLKRIWPRVRKSIERLMQLDPDADGILSGAQYNTLDAAWYGEIAWTSSLYLAALRAGAAMAREAGDAEDFAARLDAIVEKGSTNLVARLYDGEYFVHKPDPAHPEANSTNAGCHIDQVLGESWARQVGLARVVPEKECVSALRSLYRYNLTPDVGTYRDGMKAIQGGRWYAMPGEGGLLMCTFPKGGAERATGEGGDAWAASYFNECMTGFEHQVAGHMLYEGLVEEGLAVERLIHDRYHAALRNPWNEVECGDHYARAMASYGVFLGACGFEYHGPKRHLGYAPRIRPEDFKAAFTAAEGFGTIEQKREEKKQTQRIVVYRGRLRLKTLAFELAKEAASVKVEAGYPLSSELHGRRLLVTFKDELLLEPGKDLSLQVSVGS
ncbi:MAG: hypothetical protein IPJ19_06050 [Planctomycetes bacterium]|nr:hypothetical protein [Planctomycetota bacterium]